MFFGWCFLVLFFLVFFSALSHLYWPSFLPPETLIWVFYPCPPNLLLAPIRIAATYISVSSICSSDCSPQIFHPLPDILLFCILDFPLSSSCFLCSPLSLLLNCDSCFLSKNICFFCHLKHDLKISGVLKSIQLCHGYKCLKCRWPLTRPPHDIKSGHNHLMWTWCNMFSRNDSMVNTSYKCEFIPDLTAYILSWRVSYI